MTRRVALSGASQVLHRIARVRMTAIIGCCATKCHSHEHLAMSAWSPHWRTGKANTSPSGRRFRNKGARTARSIVNALQASGFRRCACRSQEQSAAASQAISCCRLALQLRFISTSKSMGHHDSGDHGWLEHRLRRRWSFGRRRCGM